MSTITVGEPAPHTPEGGRPRLAMSAFDRVHWGVSDTLTIAKRNIIAYLRNPETLFFSSVQPVMFVILFRFVFGGALGLYTNQAHVPYVNYLMAGIYVQTVAFSSIATCVGVAEDLQKGLIERFRALPMARSAVLAGRTVADLCRNILVVLIITVVGYLVGFRIQAGIFEFLGAVFVLLLFGYTLSWCFAFLGLAAPNSETAQVMAFPLLFPLTFASSAFVVVHTMPSWLQGFANNQPVSVVINAARGLMVGPNAARLSGSSTGTLTGWALLWLFGTLAVLVPTAAWAYRRRT